MVIKQTLVRSGMLALVCVTAGVVSACGAGGPSEDALTGGPSGTDFSTTEDAGSMSGDVPDDTTPPPPGAPAASGKCLPANVAQIMKQDCATSGCHAVAAPGKPALSTYADLVAASAIDPSKTEAQRSLARMKETASPMPPGGGLAAAAIATFEAWVNGGAKAIACAGAAPADAGAPFNEFKVPATCTHGKSRAGSGAAMDPGSACNRCHGFSVAGTVYPTAHEPNNCNGVNGVSGALAGTKVVITDAKGGVHDIAVNSAGNFLSSASFAAPYHVKIVGPGNKTRVMATAIHGSMGDCNSCHTQKGSGSPAAPGRILQPR